MIAYTEKGEGQHRAVRAAGHWLEHRDGAWVSSDDAAVQPILDAYDPLPDAKARRIAEIKAEAVARIQAIFPAIADADMLDLVAQIIQSIAPAARQTTARLTSASNIYTAAKNAIASVNAATTVAGVAAVVVAWP